MIEAVGWQYFKTFFRKCSDLLVDDGLMALQAIVIDDDLYELEKASKSFANTVVFPGGCLPSERVINELVTHETDMNVRWVDDITPHYSEDAPRMAPALRGGVAERFAATATTSASGGCGRSTSPSPRAASASGASATFRWSSRSPGFAPPALREPALAVSHRVTLNYVRAGRRARRWSSSTGSAGAS